MNPDLNGSPKRSPLAGLAKVIAACGRRGVTPVIKCHSSIVFHDDFYLALCQAVREASGCNVHLDLLPGYRLAGRFSSLRRKHTVNRLSQHLSGEGTVSATIALSRTGQSPSEIIIGFAGRQDELPPYAKAIELAA
jgi:hypothetical protein